MNEIIPRRSESEMLKRRYRIEFYEGSLGGDPTEVFYSDEVFPAIHKGDLVSPRGWGVVPESDMSGKIFEVLEVVHCFSQATDESIHSLSVLVSAVPSPDGIA